MMVLFLCGLVAFILMRTLHNDYQKYNSLPGSGASVDDLELVSCLWFVVVSVSCYRTDCFLFPFLGSSCRRKWLETSTQWCISCTILFASFLCFVWQRLPINCCHILCDFARILRCIVYGVIRCVACLLPMVFVICKCCIVLLQTWFGDDCSDNILSSRFISRRLYIRFCLQTVWRHRLETSHDCCSTIFACICGPDDDAAGFCGCRLRQFCCNPVFDNGIVTVHEFWYLLL